MTLGDILKESWLSISGNKLRSFLTVLGIIIGVMATMLMPAIDGAGSKARNAKLKNDMATLDQAIATYKLEQGSLPASLENLVPDYIAKNKGFKDAKNDDFQYSVSGNSYTLTGSDAEGNTVNSNGSAAVETQG